jgi:opacity protein-like surface antigen
MMKRVLIATAALGLMAGAANAQAAWQPINQRQANLEQRIDVGVRNGQLTRAEADSLRAEFRSLSALEARYRATGGLDNRERADLDSRFTSLSLRIRDERSDRQGANWTSINQRQAQLEQRIDIGLRNGRLTRAEADRLRAEFRSIAAIEARYRATGGLDNRERADLDARFNALSARIRLQANDTWRPVGVNQRQANLNARIDAGVRSGQISPIEAARLRTEFAALARLEDQYRATGGLTNAERQDLERRFDSLGARIRFERRDWWQWW